MKIGKKSKKKIITLIISFIVFFQMMPATNSADVLGNNRLNVADASLRLSQDTYTNEFNPMTLEELIEGLHEVAKEQGIGETLKNTYSIREVVEKLINNLSYEIDIQSVVQGVPKEMICAVLFREMICLDIIDKIGDGVVSKTMGISQISAEGVRYNDKFVADRENIKPKYQDYSNKQLNTMLENDNLSIGFAATALKARAYRENIPIDTQDETDIKKIFADYNDYNGQIPIISAIGKKIGLNIKLPEIGPVQYKETYGKETYEYYLLFKRYFN